MGRAAHVLDGASGFGLARTPFHDVRGNRNSCTAKLCAKTEAFLPRKQFRQVIDSNREVVGHRENSKLAMISAHDGATWQ
jgi:hypothetical protein